MQPKLSASFLNEFNKNGKVTSLHYLKNELQPVGPWALPENPIDYVSIINKKGGIETLNPRYYGSKVGIIGAGVAGLCAAYELMRVGLKPIIFEATGRLGGRAYTYKWPGDPNAQAELGAMRIPANHVTVFEYLKKWNIETKPFQNPLEKGHDTILYVDGVNGYKPVRVTNPNKLPHEVQNVKDKWSELTAPMIKEIQDAYIDYPTLVKVWQKYVKKYQDVSFYEVLRADKWRHLEIELFGSIGIGSGGFDSFWGVTFLEMLRVGLHKDEVNQKGLIGGVTQIADNFYNQRVDCANWGNVRLKDVAELVVGKVQTITTESKYLKIAVSNSTKFYFVPDAILTVAPPAIDLNIGIQKDLFPDLTQRGIRRLPSTASGKIFIRTKRPFWKSDKSMVTTLTDLPLRQVYLFDKSDWGTESSSGVILLSYTWGNSAIKFDSLNEKGKVDACIRYLRQIYPSSVVDKIKSEMVEMKSIQWSEQEGFTGGFRMADLGRYEEQQSMYQNGYSSYGNKGLFLAGEAVAWLGLSGWIEGAMHTGINSAFGVVDRLNHL